MSTIQIAALKAVYAVEKAKQGQIGENAYDEKAWAGAERYLFDYLEKEPEMNKEFAIMTALTFAAGSNWGATSEGWDIDEDHDFRDRVCEDLDWNNPEAFLRFSTQES